GRTWPSERSGEAPSATDTDRSDTDKTTMRPAARPSSPNERSIGALTNARCEREQRCDNIGKGKTYESREKCQATLKDDLYDKLGPDECKEGVDQGAPQECLKSVREEACGSALDTIGRLFACRSTKLCKD